MSELEKGVDLDLDLEEAKATGVDANSACPSEVAGVASAWPITASATSAFEKHYQRLYQRVATRGSSQLDFEPTSLVLMP